MKLTPETMEVAWVAMMKYDLGDPITDEEMSTAAEVLPQFLALMKGAPAEYSLFKRNLAQYAAVFPGFAERRRRGWRDY